MNNPLDQMTNEELGKLFPIILSESNPDWPLLFESKRKGIENAYCFCLNHLSG